MQNDLSTFKRQLAQLQELFEAGALPSAQYQESKALLERRILDAVLSQAADAPPAAIAPPPQAGALNQSHAPPVAPTPVAAVSPPAGRAPRAMHWGLGGLVLGIAVLGYWWSGAPQFWSIGPSQELVAGAPAPSGAASAAHSTEAQQIAAMVERLAQRMKEQPQDAEGWAMLARSYTVLERHTDALTAYEKAIALRADDAQLLADYADSLAVKNGRSLSGEPMKWVEKALKLEPKNLKALALAGTEAFVRKDYAAAVKYWDQVAQFAPPDSSYAQQVQAGLAEARQLGNLPAPKTLSAAAASASTPLGSAASATAGGPGAASAGASPVGDAGSAVSGVVSLTPALAAQAGPEDTVFVFARAVGGERMPLAILRKKVKDLPFEFVLDDSMAMSPAAKLSSASSVVISARVSKTGEALPSSGDLSGQVGPVNLGSKGLKLEIREAIK